MDRVDGTDGVGLTSMMGSCSGDNTRNALERRVTECQFADDMALLASTRSGAEMMAQEYQRAGGDFGLTVSI